MLKRNLEKKSDFNVDNILVELFSQLENRGKVGNSVADQIKKNLKDAKQSSSTPSSIKSVKLIYLLVTGISRDLGKYQAKNQKEQQNVNEVIDLLDKWEQFFKKTYEQLSNLENVSIEKARDCFELKAVMNSLKYQDSDGVIVDLFYSKDTLEQKCLNLKILFNSHDYLNKLLHFNFLRKNRTDGLSIIRKAINNNDDANNYPFYGTFLLELFDKKGREGLQKEHTTLLEQNLDKLAEILNDILLTGSDQEIRQTICDNFNLYSSPTTTYLGGSYFPTNSILLQLFPNVLVDMILAYIPDTPVEVVEAVQASNQLIKIESELNQLKAIERELKAVESEPDVFTQKMLLELEAELKRYLPSELAKLILQYSNKDVAIYYNQQLIHKQNLQNIHSTLSTKVSQSQVTFYYPKVCSRTPARDAAADHKKDKDDKCSIM